MDYIAYAQLDTYDPDTIATTVVARTAGFNRYMGGEIELRGFVFGWGKTLPWLLERAGLDPAMVPASPFEGAAVPTEGQVWPRGAGQG